MGEKARAENMDKELSQELELQKAKIMEQAVEMQLVEDQVKELVEEQEQHMADDMEFMVAREQAEHMELAEVEVRAFMAQVKARYLFNKVALS